ncbi:MAG: Rieske 2Fe-2S domain-containing protein [Pyrinomonadaceae bacterium]|nr:Rieske 2Fe-2S domain-containing protein [Chloracidobacterium sp.]HRI03178.1 Rieske 2Fe-2S domain-containing protein [Pyrinomonadaceae bacterium]
MNSKAFDQETVKKILAGDGEISDENNVREATAPFQAEFPYERDSEAQVTRREFCNFLFLTSSALFVGAAGFAGKAAYDAGSPKPFAPAKIDGAMSIEPGTALNFTYPAKEDTAILIRGTDGTYAAFGQKCTHLSCPVFYSQENDRLECPCHNGGFNSKTGEVLYGPPPRPLDRIELETINGEIFAVKREVRGHEG